MPQRSVGIHTLVSLVSLRQAVVLAACMVALEALPAASQTDASLRIRSLGGAFAGTLDDYLTDVYLNPAVTGVLERPQVYVHRLASRSVTPPYPYARRFLGVETYKFYSSRSPIAAALFGNLGDRFATALAVEVDWRGDEDVSSTTNQRVNPSGPFEITEERASDYALQHVLVDLSLSTRGRRNLWGARARGAYNYYEGSDAFLRTETRWNVTDPVNTYLRQEGEGHGQHFEQTAFHLLGGAFRSSGLIEDAVIGVGWIVEEFVARYGVIAIEDEDADRNGISIEPGTPDASFDISPYRSERKYDGPNLLARLHLRMGNHWKNANEVGFSRLSGGGSANQRSRHDTYGSNRLFTRESAAYHYDGTRSHLGIQSRLAYHATVFDDVLVAVGVHAFFVWDEFEESAPGTASAAYGGRSSPLDTVITSQYLQTQHEESQVLAIAFPLGAEWWFHKHAALRIGVTLFANRSDSDEAFTREAAAFVLPNAGAGPGHYLSTDGNVSSTTSVTYSNGLEFNFGDRFVLDLLVSSGIDLARYGYVSARYRF